MELGLTFPLQRFLRRKPPDYGTQPDRRFCWDLHSIHLRGHSCLLAVHCHSRYTFVRYDVAPLQWADLPGLFRDGLLDSLTAAGFSQARTEAYLRQAGDIVLTRTHGRREVAFPSSQGQPLLDHAVNTRPSRCAGSEGLGTGLARLTALFQHPAENT